MSSARVSRSIEESVIKTVKAPAPFPSVGFTVFLAGSIEMGRAEHWQRRVAAALCDCDITLLDPRRDDWDSTWIQHRDNPQFRAQVEWELAAQERADLIAMYFVPGTQSPISLLELGLFARTGKMRVCCPEGFWRKGNVDIVCQRYGIPEFASLEALILAIRDESRALSAVSP